MAYGIKSAQSAATNGAAVVWKETTTGKLLAVSTVGNSGTVYIGPAGVSNSTGMAIKQDTIIDFGHTSTDEQDFDFGKLYVYGTGSDKISFIYLDRD